MSNTEPTILATPDGEGRWWGHCPRCESLHTLDEEQAAGIVSIICTVCNWHGYAEKTSDA